MSELLEYASEYGFSIIPCGPDKKPLVPWKEFSERRATEEEITRWCRELQPACWAVVCGEISGIIVLDFDGEPGLQTLKRLNLRPHVRTPSGGCHLYVRHPGRHVPTVCGKSKKGFAELYPACDIRADGGYVLFCGSTPKGNYRVLRPLTEPEPWESLPPDLRLLAIGIDPRYVKIFRRYIEEASVGCRNQTGFELAVQLRDNGCPKETAEEIMRVYAESVPQATGERYTVEEALASLKQAYLRPPREPWNVATEECEEHPQLDEKPRLQWFEDSGCEDTVWLRPGLIPQGGIVIVSGEPGVGKTTLACELAFCLAAGVSHWGEEVIQSRVLWLAFDDSFERLRSDKFDLYGDVPPKSIANLKNAPPLGEVSLQFYVDLIRSEGFDVVVADTVVDWFDLQDYDKAAPVRRAMELVRRLVQETGVTVVGLCHTSKDRTRVGVARVAHSTQFTAKGDVVVLLERDYSAPGLVCFEVAKNRLGPSGWKVSLQKHEMRFIPCEDNRPRSTVEQVYEIIRKHGQISRQDLLKLITGVSVRSIDKAVRKLRRLGEITAEHSEGNLAVYSVLQTNSNVDNACKTISKGFKTGFKTVQNGSKPVLNRTEPVSNRTEPVLNPLRDSFEPLNPSAVLQGFKTASDLESNTLNPADENGTNSKDDKDEHETVSIDNDYDYFLDEDEHDTNSADDEYNFLDEDDVKPAPLADNESDDLPFGIDAGPPENEVPELEAVFADVPSSYDPYSQPWDGDESGFYDPLRPRAYCLQCGLPVALRVMNDDICASLEGWRYYVCARCGHLKALRYPRLAEMQSYRVLFSQNIAHGG